MAQKKNTSRKTSVKKASKNQRRNLGVGLALAVALLVAGYFVIRWQFPYLGWKSVYLPNEKMTLRYPSDWKVELVEENGGTDCAYDFVDFRNPKSGKVTISMQNSIDLTVPQELVAGYDTLTFQGEDHRMNFLPSNAEEPKPDKVISAQLSQMNPENGSYPGVPTRNEAKCNAPRNLAFDLMYVPDERVGQSETDIETFKSDPNYKTIKKIIESAVY